MKPAPREASQKLSATWRRTKRALLTLIALYALSFLVLNALGSRHSAVTADCIVVPGARVDADGHPGRSLESRLQHALELYKTGRSKHVLCTGGRGESGVVEAEAARDYLVAGGIPREAIALEGMSHNTWENFVFAQLEMRLQGWRSCLIVTDPFHMQRCLAMAGELGIQAEPAPTFAGPGWRPSGMLYYTSREMGSWLKYGSERAGRFALSSSAPNSTP